MKSINKFLFLFIFAIITMPLLCMAESPKCRYAGKKTSVFVPYVNAETNADLEESPMINVGFNDDPSYNPFIMDTGSCGIVASPDMFQPAADAINLGPGETTYTNGSFVRVLTGTYWTATQQIYDANGRLLATSHVPVLQVTQETDNGQPAPPPSNFALMGIGFGREGSDQPPKTPALNAFLNLTSIRYRGKLRRLPRNWVNGYIVSAEGIELGLTAKNTRNAGFIKLTYWDQYATSDLPEWMPMSMTVCVNGECGDGMSVMDTGITGGIIYLPTANLGPLVNCPGTQQPKCLGDGNIISVYYPNQINPVAFYTFTVGQTGNPMQPDSVAVQTRPTVYWNTSRHFLNGMNFVYDNTHGYAGFIWNHKTSHQYGYVKTKHRNKHF